MSLFLARCDDVLPFVLIGNVHRNFPSFCAVNENRGTVCGGRVTCTVSKKTKRGFLCICNVYNLSDLA